MAQFSVKIIRLNGAVLDENQHSRIAMRRKATNAVVTAEPGSWAAAIPIALLTR